MKPKTCDTCGSNEIGRYVYGYPSAELFEDPGIHDGSLRMGGCVISDENPAYFCQNCDTEWDEFGKALAGSGEE